MDYFDWYASYLHRTCPVADGHLNLVAEVYRRRLKGETGILNQYYKKEFSGSGVNLVFASLFLNADELRDCRENDICSKGAVLKKAMEMLAAFWADLEETKGRMQLITDKNSLLRATAKRGLSGHHRVGVVLCLEGLDMLEGEPELLRCFYAMGVRGAAPLWHEQPQKAPAAITDKGVEILLLMERLGMFVDSSGLSRQAAWLLPSFTKKPFAATHSGAEALLSHEGNLTEEEIKEIAGRGGVIGVNACGESVLQDQSEKPAVDAVCDQILYLVKTAGESHVGLGLDPGDKNMLTGCRELKDVTAQLLRRGLSAEMVKKIIGGNWICYLQQILKE